MENKTNDRKSVIMIVSSMLIFGTIGIFRRFIPLSSAFLAFARGILGGLFLLAFVRLKKKGTGEKLASRDLRLLAFTGALIGINWMLLFEAYNHTTVAIATLCYYMQPTIVVLLSPFIFKEKLTTKKALCAAAAIIGMVLVSGVIGDRSSQSGNLKGILLGLGAAVFYATVVIMNKQLRGIDAYLLLTNSISSGGFSLTAVILLLVVGIVHTGIAYVMYFGSMDGLRVQSIALLSYIDPVSALLLSALFLREPLSALSILGAVLIIGSAIISEI